MLLSYARVSLPEQARDGATSIQQQQKKNNAIAQLRTLSANDMAEYVDAGVSGSIQLGLRPAGHDMLDGARKGDVIVASKLDRLFRSARDTLTTVEILQEKGIEIILVDMGVDPVTSNGPSKLFFSMLAAFAEFERGRINERMADGRRGKRARGGFMGGKSAPYGYKVVGEGRDALVVENPEETPLLERVWRMRNKPIREQASILRKEGFLTRTGRYFQEIQIARIQRQCRERGKELKQVLAA
jgi:putative DNA-invertase from lambdoid prophage Rac